MVTDTLSQTLGWAIPTLLIVIALGFIYVKFLKPWVMPMLKNLWGWTTKQRETSQHHGPREVSFE